jgi:PAS domain S-box-containing protein
MIAYAQDSAGPDPDAGLLRSQRFLHLVSGLGIFGILTLCSVFNYPLFHLLAELFGIVLASSIFIMAWNARRILDDSFILLIGIAYLFVALTDLMHTLYLPHLALIPGASYDASMQFWVAARYLEGISLLCAPLLLGRRVRARLLLSGYALVFAAVAGLTILRQASPLCVVIHGLTPIRCGHAVAAAVLFAAASTTLIRARARIDSHVYRLLLVACGLSIAAEFSFVSCIDRHGLPDLIGHFLKISSFYVVYKAIVEIGLRKPYDLIFRDLKQRERLISESERRYREIVEDQTELICRYKPDGTITFVNDACCRYFGKAQRDLLGQKFIAMLPQEDQPLLRAMIASLDRDKPVATIEHRVVAPDGSTRWQRWTNRIVFDDECDSIEYQGVGRDITAEKQSEEAVQDSERWRAVGALAGGMAHSFNTILDTISGAAASIADSVIPSTRPHEEAGRILDATRRAGELTRRLMTAATVGRPRAEARIEPVSLRNALRDAADFVSRTLAEKGVAIELEPPQSSLYVRAESEQLLEIFVGLFLNAVEAMPEGGTISVQASERRIRRVSARANPDARAGSFVVVSIHDTGTGMTRETLAHIFDTGFTTRKDGFAFGLGLSVAQRMIRAYGGWINVRSRPGEGSTFHLFLPRTDAPDGAAETVTGAVTGRTILVVDDKPDILTAALDALQEDNHHVLTADNAKAAMLLYRQYADEAALLIVDLLMPGQDDRPLIDELIACEPRAALLVTSGFSREFARTYVRRGSWGFLQKPFSADDLRKAVRDALAAWSDPRPDAVPAL